jgi:hypothetical protein
MEDPTGMPVELSLHLGMLVAGVIVDDGMDQLAGRDRALDGIEEADELLVAVSLHTAARDDAIERVEGGKQGGGAVPLIDAVGLAPRACDRDATTAAGRCPMQQPNDLSRSLSAFNPESTLIAVVEMSQSSWLVAGIVPGLERHPLKKLTVDEGSLLRLLQRWGDEAIRDGSQVERIALPRTARSARAGCASAAGSDRQ